MKRNLFRVSIAWMLAALMLLGGALPMAAAEGEHDPEALVWESEAETAGEVKATRTYTLRNAMEETITELYVYPKLYPKTPPDLHCGSFDACHR